ncbi:guanylate kinase [Candidatus Peregrinibacteria bacterium]|nr:guanylate kinase [Candidatus Peregrinibacteria bacterium]
MVALRQAQDDTFKGKLVLIMGPSGVGKSVILQKLRERHPEIHFPRSATTRMKRPGEGDRLYRFMSDRDFDELLSKNALLEHAVVHGGARYGTLKDEIIPYIEQGKTVVREVDVQGFDSIRTHELFRGPSARYRLQSIFILPESKEQLITHITTRAPMSEEELNRRIASMERELTYAELADITIRNVEGKLEETLQEVEGAIEA